ncbi:hypothetical protein [Pseudomonas aeruginosa]|uniref:hypothetical protein n=1 Tax=Pseudomonas aeruginosa TaxID=287 RepID=UPI001F24D496|nr:hypothetical protein [Pseudomonas aeruginosa]
MEGNMALDLFKMLIDAFIALLNERKRHRAVSYEHYILPTFNAAKLVYNDYQDFYNVVERDLKKGVPFEDMVEFVMERRDLLYSERVLLRKSIAEVPSQSIDPFDEAVIQLVSGSHTVAHEFHHFSSQLGLHAVRHNTEAEAAHARALLIYNAQQQAAIMQGRFDRVVGAYVAIRDKVAER